MRTGYRTQAQHRRTARGRLHGVSGGGRRPASRIHGAAVKVALGAATMLGAGGPAAAQDLVLKPVLDARVRYEHVDQAGLHPDANAVTARVRGGVSAEAGTLSGLIEAQGTLAPVGQYYDGLEGSAPPPLVADPQNIALYRAQLQYKSGPLALTAGRQRIQLDDERFVGAVDFRQNGQTFDAVRLQYSGMAKVKVDLTYAWGVRTIWGIDGGGARQQAASGDNLLGNLSYATPLGTVTAFAYLVDQDEAALQGYRLSSQSYGGRLAGAHAFSEGAKLSYQASFARQAAYRRNPNRYRANYYLVDAALQLRALKLGAGYEVLGADRGVALTSFQTPLATAFKFQGWADKFLTTPPNGVRDLYASLGYSFPQVGRAKAVTLQAAYHRFDSDRLSQHYGNELNLLASAKLGRYTLTTRFAEYRAEWFATDTRKAWVQMDFAL
ncbi:MAG: hypothetical protein JWM38_947 [Sphingomonas bacterium]|nr:hypothetical protein [Sphingomonas bacterium]